MQQGVAHVFQSSPRLQLICGLVILIPHASAHHALLDRRALAELGLERLQSFCELVCLLEIGLAWPESDVVDRFGRVKPRPFHLFLHLVFMPLLRLRDLLLDGLNR